MSVGFTAAWPVSRRGSCDQPQTIPKLGVGGPGPNFPGHNRRRGRRGKHPAGDVGGGVNWEQRVSRAAQPRRLQGVGRYVRECVARAEAGDGARCKPSSRAPSWPLAQRPGRLAAPHRP